MIMIYRKNIVLIQIKENKKVHCVKELAIMQLILSCFIWYKNPGYVMEKKM